MLFVSGLFLTLAAVGHVVGGDFAIPTRPYQPGTCHVIVTQRQKPKPDIDSYTFDVRITDNNFVTVGGVLGLRLPSHETYCVPNNFGSGRAFNLTAGEIDDDPVTFAFDHSVWDSDNTDCHVGTWDHMERQLSCDFWCA